MRVTAALCWYAETPETLMRCVKSLTGYCDYLVAYGGRWDGFPPVVNDDTGDQVNAIINAAEIDWLIYFDQPWESQVEKRAAMMEKASETSDWIFVIDADEYIASGDPDKFRQGLADTELDVARIYTFRVPLSYGRQIRRVYRAGEGYVTVKSAHNGYVTGDGRCLHGNPAYWNLEPAVDLDKSLSLAHDLTARGQSRKRAREAYLKFRRSGRVEVWS